VAIVVGAAETADQIRFWYGRQMSRSRIFAVRLLSSAYFSGPDCRRAIPAARLNRASRSVRHWDGVSERIENVES
jgi:hypothetical protein